MPNPVVFTTDGLQKALNAIGNGATFGGTNWRFRLYVNNYTPLLTSVVADFTDPANGGYGVWSSMGFGSLSSAAGVATQTFGSHTFTFSAGGPAETVYGWCFDVFISGTWYTVAARLLDNPYVVPGGGGTYAINPTFTIRKLP